MRKRLERRLRKRDEEIQKSITLILQKLKKEKEKRLKKLKNDSIKCFFLSIYINYNFLLDKYILFS